MNIKISFPNDSQEIPNDCVQTWLRDGREVKDLHLHPVLNALKGFQVQPELRRVNGNHQRLTPGAAVAVADQGGRCCSTSSLPGPLHFYFRGWNCH